MECQKEQNLKDCGCTYAGCDRKGMCCECISYHLSAKQHIQEVLAKSKTLDTSTLTIPDILEILDNTKEEYLFKGEYLYKMEGK